MNRYQLEPTIDQITSCMTRATISSNEARRRALIENMQECLQQMEGNEMTDQIRTLHTVLSLLLEEII